MLNNFPPQLSFQLNKPLIEYCTLFWAITIGNFNLHYFPNIFIFSNPKKKSIYFTFSYHSMFPLFTFVLPPTSYKRKKTGAILAFFSYWIIYGLRLYTNLDPVFSFCFTSIPAMKKLKLVFLSWNIVNSLMFKYFR